MIMQRKDSTSTNEAQASITAISVNYALVRALDTGYDYLFTNQERELARHFFFTSKRLFPLGINWVLLTGVSALPYSLQQSFFNNTIANGYDNIIMLRKMMVKNVIEKAIANGKKQIIILGGGYDTRAFIASHQHPDVQ